MNKDFDHYMKNGLLAFLGITAVFGLLIYSYMDSHELTFKEMIKEDVVQLANKVPDMVEDVTDQTESLVNNTSGDSLLTIHEENSFDIVSNFEIHSSTEDILFVSEERDDILVIFDRKLPDTDKYDLTYSASSTKDTIRIKSDLDIKGYYSNKHYKGSITIYVPVDYHCDILTIESDISPRTLSLPDHVNSLKAQVAFGSIDIDVTTPLDLLDLSINAGDLNFTTTQPVDTIKASVDTGNLNFQLSETARFVEIDNDLGAITANILISPTDLNVNCSVGDVTLIFNEPILSLDADVDLGDLTIQTASEDDGLVYYNVDLGDMDSRLSTTSDKQNANIHLDMNVGSIAIK